MNNMVVKVQLPLATNEPTPLALIYNEDKSVIRYSPITKSLKKRMGSTFKKYFNAEVSQDGGTIELLNVAQEQAW